MTTDIIEVLADLMSDDQQEAEHAEREIERLCAAGDALAQRSGLGLVYLAWRTGLIWYPDFHFRAEQILRSALEAGNLLQMFHHTREDEDTALAHAEFLLVLDHMADRGDELAARGLSEVAGHLSSETLRLAGIIGSRVKALAAAPAPITAPSPVLPAMNWSFGFTLNPTTEVR